MIANLLKLNVQDHVEKKNGLTYLSWAWAWAEALKADPAATFHVDTFQRADATTIPYMDINGTAMVWVRTTLFGKEMTCMLPVMDHRNKPIPNPDAFQVNTAIMRCLTKCLAMHGLGLYIYAGEDLPEDDGVVKPPAPKTEKPTVKPPAPEAEKPTVKPPAKAEGEPGKWQITVKTKPDATPTDFINIVSEMAVVALGQATSQAEVMEIYKVNRSIFDKVKEIDADCHKDLLEAFKTKKDSFQ
jgi:hypothetical protein